MTKVILIVLVIIVVGVLVAALATQPDVFSVTRSARIKATASVVYDHVNNLHKWQTWSPWARMDPDAKYAFEGPEAGTGAAISWEGKKTGAGKMTVVEADPYNLVRFKLDFYKPFKSTNEAKFTFKSEGDETFVTWTMSGKNNLVGKVMGLFMNCEKMIGEQFDQGFANLNETVQAKPATQS